MLKIEKNVQLKKNVIFFDKKFKQLVANATLFGFYLFLVSYSGVATSTLDIHYFCLWTFLEVDWKLVFAVELSCSDCVQIKVSRGNVPFPHWDSNPCLTYQWL